MLTASRGASRPCDPNQTTTPIRPVSKAPVKPAATARIGPPSLLFPLIVGAVHLLIGQITATLAFRYGTSTSDSRPFSRNLPMPDYHDGITGLLVDPLRTWDGLWYRLIAVEGYDFSKANAAFWPLFP